MRRARRWCVALLAAGGLVLGWGCDGGKPPVETSMTEVTVAGKITKGGKPVTKGSITFDPANYRRKDVMARSAPINEDGSYSITTLIGSNLVEVRGTGATGRQIYTERTFEAARGENTFNIELP
jgi:hypothetical protein